MAHQLMSVLIGTTAVTALAVAASTSLFVGLKGARGLSYDGTDLIDCLVISILVGAPILFYLISRSERLKEEHARVAMLNVALEQTHADLAAAHERLAFAASYDKMTGLLNREHFLLRLEDAHRAGGGVLLIADADHFKQINDRFGHLQGDEALVRISAAIKQAVRPQDHVGRIGGEEFGILLNGADLEEASGVAERIRCQVELIHWPAVDGHDLPLSVSIGGAAITSATASAIAAFECADRGLYEAKRSGRNRVQFEWMLEEVA